MAQQGLKSPLNKANAPKEGTQLLCQGLMGVCGLAATLGRSLLQRSVSFWILETSLHYTGDVDFQLKGSRSYN